MTFHKLSSWNCTQTTAQTKKWKKKIVRRWHITLKLHLQGNRNLFTMFNEVATRAPSSEHELFFYFLFWRSKHENYVDSYFKTVNESQKKFIYIYNKRINSRFWRIVSVCLNFLANINSNQYTAQFASSDELKQFTCTEWFCFHLINFQLFFIDLNQAFNVARNKQTKFHSHIANACECICMSVKIWHRDATKFIYEKIPTTYQSQKWIDHTDIRAAKNTERCEIIIYRTLYGIRCVFNLFMNEVKQHQYKNESIP